MTDDRTLADAFRRQGRARPDAVACRFQGRDLTFGELDRRSSQVAKGLVRAGCRPGARVAIIGKNSDAFLEILGGTMKARAVLVAVNWRLAAPEVAYVLRHAGADLVFVDEEFAPLATEALKGVAGAAILSIGREAGPQATYQAFRDREAADDPGLDASPDEVFVQMYTSGTTGLPKGVQLTHANYLACFSAMERLPWNRAADSDVIFAPAPFFHVNGLNSVLRSIRAGSRLLTLDQFRPDAVVDLFEAERVTRATLAPAMIQMCLEVPGVAQRDFSALQMVTYGGSPISETVLKRAAETFGCRFAQGYGMTEMTGPVTMLTPDDHGDEAKLTSCGRPLPGIEVKVVRPDGTACAAREVGEVVARGATMTLGYWQDPDATGRTIRDGWLHTGDAGYFDEAGYLYIHDRVKDMIVSGGENVYPAEVENALAKDPDVADAAVIGVPDAKWGEAVKALVVLRPGAARDPAAIIARARSRIAGYKAPKSVEFVDAIPRNAAGKILRRELRAPYWADQARAVN